MSSEPSAEPLTRNWTPATPVLSDASAATGTMPETVDPPAGACHHRGRGQRVAGLRLSRDRCLGRAVAGRVRGVDGQRVRRSTCDTGEGRGRRDRGAGRRPVPVQTVGGHTRVVRGRAPGDRDRVLRLPGLDEPGRSRRRLRVGRSAARKDRHVVELGKAARVAREILLVEGHVDHVGVRLVERVPARRSGPVVVPAAVEPVVRHPRLTAQPEDVAEVDRPVVAEKT